MSCSVALEEEISPDFYVLRLEGKFEESIQHLFHHFRNKMLKNPRKTYFDLAQVEVLKEVAQKDLFHLFHELETQNHSVRLLKVPSFLLPILQEEKFDPWLMTPEELKSQGFSSYLSAKGDLPYTLPLPPLPVPSSKSASSSRSKLSATSTFEEDDMEDDEDFDKSKSTKTSKNTQKSSDRLVEKLLAPFTPNPVAKQKFVFSGPFSQATTANSSGGEVKKEDH
jgi:ABC-type transporter Mla MlaB component